jgi:predicted transcriptional regulator
MNPTSHIHFESTQKLANLISREYCWEFFRLLYVYHDISASEAATRLEIHTKTAQDFLDGLAEQGILIKREAGEKKRPYYRYSLKKRRINITLDLDSLFDWKKSQSILQWSVRERKNSGAVFKEGRGSKISSINIYDGKGRSRKERSINLTISQGQFLFHLPFPTEPSSTVQQVCDKAGISDEYLPEVLDLVELLEAHGIFDRK